MPEQETFVASQGCSMLHPKGNDGVADMDVDQAAANPQDVKELHMRHLGQGRRQ